MSMSKAGRIMRPAFAVLQIADSPVIKLGKQKMQECCNCKKEPQTMKTEKIPRCPGCSKHCPLSAPRCKYGRTYAAKKMEKEIKPKCKHKWEGYVTLQGEIWQMLTLSRAIKKGLCHSRVTETQLLSAITPEQRQALAEILQKLSLAVPKSE